MWWSFAGLGAFPDAVDEAGCPVGHGYSDWGGRVRAGLVVCQEQIRLDEADSLGIAGAVLVVLLAVGAWWAPHGADSGIANGAMREQADPVQEKTADVENTISGGTFSGPVIQGRDFTGLTFGASPAPPASQPKDPDVG